MNALQSQHLAAMEELVNYYRRERHYAVREARRSLAAARRELDRIAEQLNLADNDEEFENIGEIRGVDASVVFRAFGAADSLARCSAKWAEYKNDAS